VTGRRVGQASSFEFPVASFEFVVRDGRRFGSTCKTQIPFGDDNKKSKSKARAVACVVGFAAVV
jgi:hypothetical protein